MRILASSVVPGIHSGTMSHVLLTTIGSLGDLHPLIGIGLELRQRGHDVRFCTSEGYRAKLQSLGFGFDPLRPNAAPEAEGVAAQIREIFDPKKGAERLLRGWILPELRNTYADLRRAVMGPPRIDLLVSGELVYPAPLVAEKIGLPWASCITAPLSFFSAYDLPILPPVQTLSSLLRHLGPRAGRHIVRMIKLATSSWSAPVRELRAELGLSAGLDPIHEGKFSPKLVLAMFSSVLAKPQPDWPRNTVVTGFPFYDGQKNGAGLPAELRLFLEHGEPPVIFTLGSSAVFDPRDFYHQSAAAAALLRRRAVLLTGANPGPAPVPKNVVCYDYIGFSDLFPSAAAIVHQGGVGTTAQAMRAGCPMLVMPYGFDQPDNGARISRLGLGKVISRRNYSAARVARLLGELLDDPEYRRNAVNVRASIQKENGASVACDALQRLLR
jgi:rhamnosyltransferase subunit B